MTKADHFWQAPRRDSPDRRLCRLCGRNRGAHPSELEAAFDEAVTRAGLRDGMVEELAFAKALGRAWRFDRAWPALLIAVELDGGSRMRTGYHTSQADRDKDNAAGLLGWQVLRLTDEHLKLGLAIPLLRAAMVIRRAPPAARAGLREALPAGLFPTESVRRALRQTARSAATTRARASRAPSA